MSTTTKNTDRELDREAVRYYLKVHGTSYKSLTDKVKSRREKSILDIVQHDEATTSEYPHLLVYTKEDTQRFSTAMSGGDNPPSALDYGRYPDTGKPPEGENNNTHSVTNNSSRVNNNNNGMFNNNNNGMFNVSNNGGMNGHNGGSAAHRDSNALPPRHSQNNHFFGSSHHPLNGNGQQFDYMNHGRSDNGDNNCFIYNNNSTQQPRGGEDAQMDDAEQMHREQQQQQQQQQQHSYYQQQQQQQQQQHSYYQQQQQQQQQHSYYQQQQFGSFQPSHNPNGQHTAQQSSMFQGGSNGTDGNGVRGGVQDQRCVTYEYIFYLV